MERIQKERDELKKNKELGEKERTEIEKQYQKNEQQLKKQFDSKINEIKLQFEVEKSNVEKMIQLEKETLEKKYKELTDKYKKESKNLEQRILNTTLEKDNVCKQLEETKQKNQQLETSYQNQCLRHKTELRDKELALTEMKHKNQLLIKKLELAEVANAETLESKLKDLEQRYGKIKANLPKEEKQRIEKKINKLQIRNSYLYKDCCII
ncbi:trichohyalin-like [Physella acuta]|uniref:trichohyalin-like n=1 Tax=Physella acuta TaxID=109671 RepID=UPI0027DC9E1E|nr:trichohyalin-like [Physella acuta]